MDFEAPCSDIEQSKEIEEKDDNIKPVVEFDKKSKENEDIKELKEKLKHSGESRKHFFFNMPLTRGIYFL